MFILSQLPSAFSNTSFLSSRGKLKLIRYGLNVVSLKICNFRTVYIGFAGLFEIFTKISFIVLISHIQKFTIDIFLIRFIMSQIFYYLKFFLIGYGQII